MGLAICSARMTGDRLTLGARVGSMGPDWYCDEVIPGKVEI